LSGLRDISFVTDQGNRLVWPLIHGQPENIESIIVTDNIVELLLLNREMFHIAPMLTGPFSVTPTERTTRWRRANLARLGDVRAGDFNRIVERTPIEGMLTNRSVQHVPERESREKRFAKDDEICAYCFRFGHPLFELN
jgi:hypothetical protein